MSHIAELVVRHPDLALTTTLEEMPDLDIRVESQPVTPADSPTLFYIVQTPEFEQFESSLASDHTVADWQANARFDDSRIYKVGHTNQTKVLTPAFTERGLRILAAAGVDGGWRLRIHAAERSQIEQFLTYCRSENMQCHVKKVFSTDVAAHSTVEDSDSLQLTDRQREVARTATEMGYFETGGASAEEVASALDITPSTLSSHLRTITEKLFHHHFGA